MGLIWRAHALAWLALGCACGAILSGCGGGQQASAAAGTSPHRPAAPAAAGTARTPAKAGSAAAPSRAQALAYARAVNLTASDIPGASATAQRSRRSNALEHLQYRACEASVQHVREIAKAASPKLSRGSGMETEELSSSVMVLDSEHGIEREFAQLEAPKVRDCMVHVLNRWVANKTLRAARWRGVTLSRLPVHLAGASDAIGMRAVVAVEIPASEVSIPFYVDELGFATGRTEVSVTAASPTQPVPAATEQELLTLLLARARSTSL